MRESEVGRVRKDKRPSTMLAVTFALLTLVAVACREPSQSASEGGGEPGKVTLAVGGQTALVYLPTTLAQELGYYEDEGLDVEIQDFEGGSEALQSLLAGSATVVSGFYDHTIQMAAEGREIMSFVTILRYPGLVLTVSPEAEGISSVKDLDGGTVGVTAPGSSTDLFLKFMLAKNDMAPDAASAVAIGATSTAVAAMERGQVDAGVMLEPAVSALEERAGGELTVLADTRTPEGVKEVFGTETYPATVFYSTVEWVEDNPETAQGLVNAIVKTLEWIDGHSPEEIVQKMPESFRGGDPAVYLEGTRNTLPTFSSDGVMEEQGPKAVLEVLSLSLEEVKNADIDLTKTYTNEFVE